MRHRASSRLRKSRPSCSSRWRTSTLQPALLTCAMSASASPSTSSASRSRKSVTRRSSSAAVRLSRPSSPAWRRRKSPVSCSARAARRPMPLSSPRLAQSRRSSASTRKTASTASRMATTSSWTVSAARSSSIRHLKILPATTRRSRSRRSLLLITRLLRTCRLSRRMVSRSTSWPTSARTWTSTTR